jgi:hypothetical protein
LLAAGEHVPAAIPTMHRPWNLSTCPTLGHSLQRRRRQAEDMAGHTLKTIHSLCSHFSLGIKYHLLHHYLDELTFLSFPRKASQFSDDDEIIQDDGDNNDCSLSDNTAVFCGNGKDSGELNNCEFGSRVCRGCGTLFLSSNLNL